MTSDEYQELMGFLERKFAAIDTRFEGIHARFEGIHSRFGGLHARFGGLDDRFGSLESRVDRNSEDIRKLGVLVDRNFGLIQTVAEGVVTLNRRHEELRTEMAAGFHEVRELLSVSHSGLDRRVTVLERRVDRLEEGPEQ